jgi:hypothetical protein
MHGEDPDPILAALLAATKRTANTSDDLVEEVTRVEYQKRPGAS